MFLNSCKYIKFRLSISVNMLHYVSQFLISFILYTLYYVNNVIYKITSVNLYERITHSTAVMPNEYITLRFHFQRKRHIFFLNFSDYIKFTLYFLILVIILYITLYFSMSGNIFHFASHFPQMC